MLLYPAVDILGGRAVRLERGEFAREKRYADDPLVAARRWIDAGARFLHVVDLDGARSGEPANLDHLSRIKGSLQPPLELIQYGGGLRSAEAAEAALAAGAGRVVIGTAAFRVPGLLSELVARWGEKIALAVDVRDGVVAVAGWQERATLTAPEAIGAGREAGVETIVYTDVDRDGMLDGIDADAVERVAHTAGDAQLLYSGGVGSLADLESRARLALPNLAGVIVGKALYEGRFTVGEALEALERSL